MQRKKQCNRCKVIKGVDCFNREAKNTAKGMGRKGECRVCQREYGRLYYIRNRDRVKNFYKGRRAITQVQIMDYLKSHPCVDCKEMDWVVLEFDHVRGVKYRGVSALVHNGYPWRTIEAEIAKCEVVCANCHRRRTYDRAFAYRSTGKFIDKLRGHKLPAHTAEELAA